MIKRFPKQKITDEVYDTLITTRYFSSFIDYIIDSKYRRAVELRKWVKEQIENPTEKVLQYCNEIDDAADPDEQMINILRRVRYNIVYKTDYSVYKKQEYWQTADETITKMSGDCEDGAVLIYVLAILKGVNKNRLLVMTGNVYNPNSSELFGHCWIAYKPNGLPDDYVFLDWCYYPNMNDMDYRNKFSVFYQTIKEYNYNDEIVPIKLSNYRIMWFAFNHDNAFRDLLYRYEV